MQSTEQQHRQGDCLRIPQVSYSTSVAYLVVNCIIPGLGTVIASWTDVEYPKWDWAVFITGLLQFGLAWIIIGWGWSIWWGVRMYQDSFSRKEREECQQMVTIINNTNSTQNATMDSLAESISIEPHDLTNSSQPQTVSEDPQNTSLHEIVTENEVARPSEQST